MAVPLAHRVEASAKCVCRAVLARGAFGARRGFSPAARPLASRGARRGSAAPVSPLVPAGRCGSAAAWAPEADPPGLCRAYRAAERKKSGALAHHGPSQLHSQGEQYVPSFGGPRFAEAKRAQKDRWESTAQKRKGRRACSAREDKEEGSESERSLLLADPWKDAAVQPPAHPAAALFLHRLLPHVWDGPEPAFEAFKAIPNGATIEELLNGIDRRSFCFFLLKLGKNPSKPLQDAATDVEYVHSVLQTTRYFLDYHAATTVYSALGTLGRTDKILEMYNNAAAMLAAEEAKGSASLGHNLEAYVRSAIYGATKAGKLETADVLFDLQLRRHRNMGILDLSARAQSLRLTGGMLIGAYLRADRIDAANAVRALLAGLGVSLKVNTIVDYLAYYARTGLVTERDRLLDEVRSSSDYRLSDGNLNTLIMSAFRGAPDDGSHMTPIARLQTAQFWLDMLQQGSRTATAQPGTAMPASPRITAPNYCRLIQAYGNVALLLEENPGIAAAFDTAIGAGMSDFVEMEARTSADSGFRFAVPGSTGSPVSADESLAGAGCRTADAAVRSESRGTLTAEKCRERGRSLLDDALVQGLPLPAGVVAPLLRALKNSGIDVLADSRFRMLWRACEPQAVTE